MTVESKKVPARDVRVGDEILWEGEIYVVRNKTDHPSGHVRIVAGQSGERPIAIGARNDHELDICREETK